MSNATTCATTFDLRHLWPLSPGMTLVKTGRLRTQHGEELVFDVVVSAVGFLSVPKTPAWPGMDEFERPCFHTARWDKTIDYEGKTVAIVGVGSSATQVIPAMAPSVKKLSYFNVNPAGSSPRANETSTRPR
ncbi:hypothetical protein [Aeromicrobium sp. UC242_57]|uniref:hypothetical protein n=1 Tax=Aeromicrobium sp. UC242_57 TaxID=3374624 RepID=UPI0037A68440